MELHFYDILKLWFFKFNLQSPETGAKTFTIYLHKMNNTSAVVLKFTAESLDMRRASEDEEMQPLFASSSKRQTEWKECTFGNAIASRELYVTESREREIHLCLEQVEYLKFISCGKDTQKFHIHVMTITQFIKYSLCLPWIIKIHVVFAYICLFIILNMINRNLWGNKAIKRI